MIKRFFLGAAAFLAAIPGGACLAQTPVESGGRPDCVPEVLSIPRSLQSGDTLAPYVYAKCGGAAVLLGPADRYEASLNTEANALAVARWNGAVASVELVFVGAGGLLHVDDLSREFAQRLGWSEAAQLSGVSIVLNDFARTGLVAATPIDTNSDVQSAITSEADLTATARASLSSAVIGIEPYRTAAAEEFRVRSMLRPTGDK